MSRDWISNEIFRRVEPSGRTMGEVLRELRFMYNIDIICGVKQEELKECIPWDYLGTWRTLKNLWYGPNKCPTYFRLRDTIKTITNRTK